LYLGRLSWDAMSSWQDAIVHRGMFAKLAAAVALDASCRIERARYVALHDREKHTIAESNGLCGSLARKLNPEGVTLLWPPV
jgi:hypothetical protein